MTHIDMSGSQYVDQDLHKLTVGNGTADDQINTDQGYWSLKTCQMGQCENYCRSYFF